MDLKVFYLQNIKTDEYHYRFIESVKNVNKVYNVFTGYEEITDFDFEIYDVEEAILKFRELCQPEVSFSDNEKKCWFYLVAYYLHKSGYEIKEFPKEEKVLVVSKNPLTTSVAENLENTDIAYLIIGYNHHLLKGNAERKKSILLALGTELEPKRAEIKVLNKEEIFLVSLLVR